MEVNDIFKELAVMVHDQGEIVDSIEASVERTEVHVERGNTELRQAVQYTVSNQCTLPSLISYLPIKD